MLEKIREGSQGAIAKIVLGAVILSFALAGIGSYLGRPADSFAAIVNGQNISNRALESAVRTERQRLQQQFGDNFEAIASNPAFMQQVRSSALDRLVVETLLDQAVNDNGLAIGSEQLKEAIRAIPGFQVEGQFSNELFNNMVQRQGYTAAGFGQLMSQDISRRQFMGSVLESEFVLDSEVTRLQALLAQTRSIRYWQIALDKLAPSITPTDEQVQAYFDSHQFAYQQPEMVSVEYVELNAKQLTKGLELSEKEIETYYQENKALYRSEEERRASHILLGDDKQVAKVQAELAAGTPFADVAKKYSLDTFSAEKGGDLDWFTPGVIGDELDAAVFAMSKVGDVSDVVTSPFGKHIVSLTGIRPSVTKPLADVKAEIKKTLLANKALDVYYQKQEQVSNLAYEMPDSLVDLAEEAELTVQQSELFDRASAPAALANPKVLEAIFSEPVLRDGMNSDAIELAEGQLMVVRLKEHQPARSKTLAEVKSQVVAAVKVEQARIQATAKAETMLATLEQGKTLDVSADEAVTALTASAMTRNSTTVEPSVRDHVFAMAKPEEGSRFKQISAGNFVTVVALDSVQQGESAVEAKNLKESLSQQSMNQAYLALVNVLRANAEITYPAVNANEG